MPSLPKTNIPDPDYVQLLGRDEELSNLKKILSSNPRFWIIAIEGLGGIGKTALGIEVCLYFLKQYGKLPQEERYDYIIWTSAKLEDMTPQGAMPRSIMQNTLTAIYKTVADILEIPERLSLSEDSLVDKIYSSLELNRTLIVIDSFEQLENPAAVMEFLENVPQPSKVLITTRPQQKLDTQYKRIKIEGLKEDICIKLISQLDTNGDLNDSQKREIATYSSGIPLVIKWALGIISLGGAYSTIVTKLKSGDLDLSQYCVADSIEFIKGRKAEEMAFILLPVVCPISRQTIGEIVDLSKDVKTRDDELDVLVNSQLISKTKGDRFSLAPIARAALLQKYDKNKQQIVVKKWATYYLQFVSEILGLHGRVDNYSDNLQKILSEVDNIIEILREIGEIDPNLYCDLLESVRYVLYMRGNWIERDMFLIKGRDIAQRTNHWCRQLLFASDLAWVSTYRQQYDKSFMFFKSVEPAVRKCNQHYYKAKYLMDLGRYHQLISIQDADYGEAEKYYFQALEEAKGANPPIIQSTCLYYLGLLYYEMGNKSQAKKCFEEGGNLASSCGATREADRHQSMLATILAESGQYTDARKIFERIVANAQSNKDRVRQADYLLEMAKVEYIVSNRQGALALFSQAENLYAELGRTQEYEGIRQFRRENGLL